MNNLFGPHKLKNSSLCYGTMQFGDGANEKDSQEMYEACRNIGINYSTSMKNWELGLLTNILNLSISGV